MEETVRTATAYFEKLSNLLLGVQATDREGRTLSLDEGTRKAVEIILSVKSGRGKVMLIGNGGSAAIANHLQNDLAKAVQVRALVFNDIPLLTAYTNDDGYECAFERPIAQWAEAGDLLIAISSSGKSENILRGVRAAEGKECQILTLSGFRPDNPLRRMGQLNFYVASEAYGYVESAHGALTHYFSDCAVKSKREAAAVRSR